MNCKLRKFEDKSRDFYSIFATDFPVKVSPVGLLSNGLGYTRFLDKLVWPTLNPISVQTSLA